MIQPLISVVHLQTSIRKLLLNSQRVKCSLIPILFCLIILGLTLLPNRPYQHRAYRGITNGHSLLAY